MCWKLRRLVKGKDRCIISIVAGIMGWLNTDEVFPKMVSNDLTRHLRCRAHLDFGLVISLNSSIVGVPVTSRICKSSAG